MFNHYSLFLKILMGSKYTYARFKIGNTHPAKTYELVYVMFLAGIIQQKLVACRYIIGKKNCFF